MHNRINGVLSKAEVAELRSRIDAAPFHDGNDGIGGAAGQVKNNLQMRDDISAYKEVAEWLMRKIGEHKEISQLAFPKLMMPPLISRYEPGMTYGAHVDAPFFRNGTLRGDVSMTLFLSEPEDYEGGELVIQQGSSEALIKLPAGDAYIYPSTYLHHVAPVRNGARVAAVTWFQSYIREERYREILAQLTMVKQGVDRNPALAAEADLLRSALNNLLREWWTP